MTMYFFNYMIMYYSANTTLRFSIFVVFPQMGVTKLNDICILLHDDVFFGGSQVCKITILKKHRETDNGFISNDYSGAGP